MPTSKISSTARTSTDSPPRVKRSASTSSSRRSGRSSNRDRGDGKTKSEPSTIRVLSYVLIVYLAYGLFTRSDEHEHLSPAAALHLPNINRLANHLPNSHDLSHLAHEASSTASRAVRYSSEYVHDHAPNVHMPRGLVDGVERVVGEGAERVGRSMRDVVGQGLGIGQHGSDLDPKAQGSKIYTMSFPSNPFGNQRSRGTNHNLFILLLTRSFSLLIHFPLVLIINLLSHLFHYISITLFLLLWTAYYLTLPLTASLTWLTQTFLLGPVSIVWACLGFFKPVAGLLGGLMGFGAAVGGVIGWVGKRLEGGIWRKADEREERNRLEKEKIEVKRPTQHRSQGSKMANLVSTHQRWLTPNTGYQGQVQLQPQLSAWADDDHLYKPRQPQNYINALPVPIYHQPPPIIYPSAYLQPQTYPSAYPYPYPYPQQSSGIMRRPSKPTATAGSSRRRTSSRSDGLEGDRTSPRAGSKTRSVHDGRKRSGSRISFAAEPTYPISDDDDAQELSDEQHGDDSLSDDEPEDDGSPSRAFHFHFHTRQGGLPATPYQTKSNSNSTTTTGGPKPTGGKGSRRGSGSASASASGSGSGSTRPKTGAVAGSSRFLQSKHVATKTQSRSNDDDGDDDDDQNDLGSGTPTRPSGGSTARSGKLVDEDGSERGQEELGVRKRLSFRDEGGR